MYPDIHVHVSMVDGYSLGLQGINFVILSKYFIHCIKISFVNQVGGWQNYWIRLCMCYYSVLSFRRSVIIEHPVTSHQQANIITTVLLYWHKDHPDCKPACMALCMTHSLACKLMKWYITYSMNISEDARGTLKICHWLAAHQLWLVPSRSRFHNNFRTNCNYMRVN